MSHYKHLTIEEREMLYLMHGQGKSFREIARTLGRAPSTISREYKRGRSCRHSYLPSRAQYRYEKRRKNCGRKHILSDPEAREKIRYYVQQLHWSPEQISNRLKMEGNALRISYPGIYRAIKAGLLDTSKARPSYRRNEFKFVKKLRRKGKKYKQGTGKQEQLHITHTIEERPQGCIDRTELGHYEGDTVLGKKGGARLLTLVDRTSRYTLIRRIPNGEAGVTRDAMIAALREMPEHLVKSVTPDRGREFAAHGSVTEELPNVTIYFPPPHSPWERGTNENTNGLIREYSPKGADIALFTDEEIRAIETSLNLRPRKCLNWATPFEFHFGRVLHLT